MRKKIALMLPALFIPMCLGIIMGIPPKSASAAYDGANLIDNGVFLNTNSMTVSDVQYLFVIKGSGLANKSFVLNCYAGDSKERQWYNAVGAPCDQNIPASHIIYYAARVYGINPQVILATLQKEQSLITSPNPTEWQINQAMGYGCPTTGGCGASNFFYQIDNGTWALRYHYERANRNFSWWSPSTSWVCGTEKNFYKPNLFPGQNVQFYDESNVPYRNYFIVNAATSALYCYTPHAYNNPEGLYGRPPFGTVGQYYSGSYNFVTYFELWFGSTQKRPTFGNVPSSNSVYARSGCNIGYFDPSWVGRLYNPDTEDFLYTSNATEACLAVTYGYIWDGLMMKNATGPDAIPVYRLANYERHVFTSDLNTRNNFLTNLGYRDEGVGFYGYASAGVNRIPVFGLQGRNTFFLTSAGKEAEYYQSSYNYYSFGPVLYTEALDTTDNNVARLNRNNTRFYTADSTERAIALSNYGFSDEGYVSKNDMMPNSINTPVYRLRSLQGVYFYTTSRLERDVAIINYHYIGEGTGFYAPLYTHLPVYRGVHSQSGLRIFTNNLNEYQQAISRYGYNGENVGWYGF